MSTEWKSVNFVYRAISVFMNGYENALQKLMLSVCYSYGQTVLKLIVKSFV